MSTWRRFRARSGISPLARASTSSRLPAGCSRSSVAATTASPCLKCDPFLSEILRVEHACITPGYHLNKRHWITIEVDGSLGDDDIFGLVEHSYERVKTKLTKAERARLDEQGAG